MKRSYYKIVSRFHNKYELRLVHFQNGIMEDTCEWHVEGTKFPVTRLDEVKKLAKTYDAEVYEVHEEMILIP